MRCGPAATAAAAITCSPAGPAIGRLGWCVHRTWISASCKEDVRGAAGHVCAQETARCRTFGGDQAAPDAVLADIPVPKRQRQALGADRADAADGDRRGRFVPGLLDLHADREPLFGIMGVVGAAGVPDDGAHKA
jgi:hypothetical protein